MINIKRPIVLVLFWDISVNKSKITSLVSFRVIGLEGREEKGGEVGNGNGKRNGKGKRREGEEGKK